MSYDFFVFPADAADDLEGATRLYESARDRGPLTPGGPVAGFLADLPATYDATGHDGSAYVRTSWDDPMGHLAVVAGCARTHGLSVLDVQLTALFDPRGAVDVALRTEAGPRTPYVTRRLVHDVVAHLTDRRYHWVELARAGQPGLRATVDGAVLEVRHRDGSTRTADPGLVEELLWAWAADDARWRRLLDGTDEEG